MSRAWLVAASLCLASVTSAAPSPPHGATKLVIDYEHTGWRHTQESYTIEWKAGRYVANNGAAIEAKLIDDLYASLTDLREQAQPLRCISHTDDYPKFKIVVDSPTDPLVIEADSNCDSYRPWNVMRGGKRLVQFTGNAWRGVGGVLAALDKGWASRRTRTAMGGIEVVPMGTYPKASGEPAACATSFEAHPDLRRLFGDLLHVDELRLTCDLGKSTDCAVVDASAELAWQGTRTTLTVGCAKGQIKLPARFAATQRTLATFVASKPARALVTVSPDPPNLRSVSRWNLQSMEPGFPTLSWTEGASVIDVRVVGKPDPRFWKQLGIEVTKLRRVDGVIDLKLDLAGKVVK